MSAHWLKALPHLEEVGSARQALLDSTEAGWVSFAWTSIGQTRSSSHVNSRAFSFADSALCKRVEVSHIEGGNIRFAVVMPSRCAEIPRVDIIWPALALG